MILVDTNIIMRHLLNDDKEQSLKLLELIENDEILISYNKLLKYKVASFDKKLNSKLM